MGTLLSVNVLSMVAFFHPCLVNCSVLSAARVVVASASYHTLKSSWLRMRALLRFSVQGDPSQIQLYIPLAASAHLLNVLTTACVGPRGSWVTRFSGVCSKVLFQVPVQPL